jgi:hypothetical protein
MAISILEQVSDDLFDNMWEIIIPAFPGVTDLVNTTLRVESINTPEIAVPEYFIDYKSQKFPKPGGKVTTAKTFDFTFRVDKYLKVYKGFVAWKSSIIDDFTGVVSPDFANGSSAFRIPISIVPIDSAGNVLSAGFIFFGSYPTKITNLQFKYEGDGAPFKCTVSCSYSLYQLR